MSTSLFMFVAFVLVTLGITFWASKKTKTTAEFYSAGRSITGFQNGWAVAGDYMSAASFLGIAGLIAFYGFDGFMYSVGWLVAYLTVLLIVAEPLRNTGKYTMADVLAFRLRNKSVRTVAALSTLTVSLFYMIAQMVGAGSLVSLLIPQISFNIAIIMVGILMLVYVIFGGMLATTWVQIVKAVLLMLGTILISILVLAHFGFNPVRFFGEIATIKGCPTGTLATKDDPANPGQKISICNDATGKESATVKPLDFTKPGLRYNGKWGALDLISLGVALIFGTAGLPHILVRFYTVPSAQEARKSVVWAMILIGSFYIMTTFLGFGAATIVKKANIGVHLTGEKAQAYIETTRTAGLPELKEQLDKNGSLTDSKTGESLTGDKATAYIQAARDAKAKGLEDSLAKNGFLVQTPNNNLAAPLLAGTIGELMGGPVFGDILLSFVSAIAFATILAVVAGLTIASSSAFTHDIWVNVIKHGTTIGEGEQVMIARISAAVIGILSIVLAIALKSLNVAFLVGLAFAVAASANVPSIILTLFWRRFNTQGMIIGMLVGLISSLTLILLSPAVMGVDAASVAAKHLIQAAPIFPLENPGIVSVPLGFIGAIVGSLLSRNEEAERAFSELNVRSNTGLGAEV